MFQNKSLNTKSEKSQSHSAVHTSACFWMEVNKLYSLSDLHEGPAVKFLSQTTLIMKTLQLKPFGEIKSEAEKSCVTCFFFFFLHFYCEPRSSEVDTWSPRYQLAAAGGQERDRREKTVERTSARCQYKTGLYETHVHTKPHTSYQPHHTQRQIGVFCGARCVCSSSFLPSHRCWNICSGILAGLRIQQNS